MAQAGTYIPAYKGYIADVPRVWFKRCDGEVFYFDEITQANATPNTNFTEINAGWSLFPVAYIPGQSTMEIAMTQGQFNAELFSLANAVDFEEDGSYQTYFTELVEFDSEGDAELTYTPVEVLIRGLVSGTDFTVDDNTVTLAQGVEIEGPVEVTYLAAVAGAHTAAIDNASTAQGEAWLRWPVYGAADDCADSSIKGYVEMHIYRCRVSQMPGFDTSYKQAATNQVTFAAMDAKRADNAAYTITYFELPEEGSNP